jgi:hypothetical protein
MKLTTSNIIDYCEYLEDGGETVATTNMFDADRCLGAMTLSFVADEIDTLYFVTYGQIWRGTEYESVDASDAFSDVIMILCDHHRAQTSKDDDFPITVDLVRETVASVLEKRG